METISREITENELVEFNMVRDENGFWNITFKTKDGSGYIVENIPTVDMENLIIKTTPKSEITKNGMTIFHSSSYFVEMNLSGKALAFSNDIFKNCYAIIEKILE